MCCHFLFKCFYFEYFTQYILIILLLSQNSSQVLHLSLIKQLFVITLFLKIQKSTQKDMESILCYPTTPEHMACHEIWFMCLVALHLRKLIFFQQVSAANSFLVQGGTLSPLPWPWAGISVCFERLQVLRMLSQSV